MTENDERARLVRALDSARNHVLEQVSSMSGADLSRSSIPSGWSPLGLVRHLTLSDERYWFEVVVDGGALDFWPAEDNGDWLITSGDQPEQVIDAYRQAIDNSNRIIDSTPLDAAPRCPEPSWVTSGAFADLRTILLHNIVETSTHAGQLDVARELADGRRYLIL